MSVAVGGMDGLLIDQYPPQGTDLSALAAEQTNVLASIKSTFSGTLEGGKVNEVIVTSDKLIGYTRLLNDDLFCLIVMNPAGNIGKARLYSEKAAQRMLEVFV